MSIFRKKYFLKIGKMRISKISENFRRKIENDDFPPKSEKSIFQNHFQHFRFFAKIVQKKIKFSVFQKFRKIFFSENQRKHLFSKRIFKMLSVLKSRSPTLQKTQREEKIDG